ncbi:hypothetical protein I3843_09G117700 [Carya illinoinensis]|uniref:DUF1365 domain-containing protein n=1 Tax=Carya illinoinensis TaxID=32201 RepID=A0A8T1PKV3_CARIL|nr:uncharacterized protein LOC122277722 [Carya illinoinensis]KAG2688992.1 hypothetical protein I3760_09G118300 [Carya illinoinensis]KAG6642141.1 hypothetical protein CIPAW_09G122400 [Carya illinoinensis]KAG6695902.1 hypothetical protein I3842_09G120000 [Carya illinoinensis]KAG7963446.1 hypothetical protein I3843_09G117700 [Carya illinoinensis]
MEVIYLLCSILSNFITSLALSLLLLFRSLFLRKYSSRAAISSSAIATEAVSLYEGTVWHERRRPVHHSFRYSVRYALFDLDHAPHPPPDHLSANQARQVAASTGPVFLLTIPPSVGYEQNPLSLYYCYDVEGSTQCLKKCIAEVTNTPWGERVTFVFNPSSDLVAKPLHVSPFMDMLGTWKIRANAPGDNLYVSISVQHPKLGDYFTATLKAKRVPLSLVSDHAMFFWLMPHRVAVWIYWHALKLWWKNVSFIQHPRYTNPAYREEALVHDRKLQCCPVIGSDEDKHLLADGSDRGCLPTRNCEIRQFTWREANWPWS